MRRRALGRQEVRLDQDAHTVVEVGLRYVVQQIIGAPHRRRNGVVDQDVELSELGDGGIHHRVYIGRAGYVGRQRDGVPARVGYPLDVRVGGRDVHVGDQHARAVARQTPGGRAADAESASGNYRGLGNWGGHGALLWAIWGWIGAIILRCPKLSQQREPPNHSRQDQRYEYRRRPQILGPARQLIALRPYPVNHRLDSRVDQLDD